MDSFLYRDFQARNVMLDTAGNPYFIDFQGGRKGPFYYDFIIIAFCVFLLVKGINKLSKKKAEEPAVPAPDPEPTAEEKLLSEIRDLLKNK